MVSFVKTKEEIERIRKIIYPTHFQYEALVVAFEIPEDFLTSILPPCFEPSRTSRIAKVQVSRWQSLRSGFDCAVVDLPARHGDFEGWYHLTHLISGDMPITVGREMWGEAKKRGEMSLTVDGNKAYGYGERNGVRLIEIEAELEEDTGPVVNLQNRIELKAFLSSDGQGLQYDPIVLRLEQNEYIDKLRPGKGTVTFRSSSADATGTIPVSKIVAVQHEVGTSTMGVLGEFPVAESREEYIPYVWGRSYDIDQTHEFKDQTVLSRSGSFEAR